MNLGTSGHGSARLVRNRQLSTAGIHRPNGLVEPGEAVFPVVHTLYDYNERF
jgi:hypothetical protein